MRTARSASGPTTVPERVRIDWAGADGRLLVERLRGSGDPHADEVVDHFAARRATRDLWTDAAEEVRGSAECDDEWIDRYLRDARPPPAWVDQSSLEAGQRFFTDNVWSLNLAFLLASLPLSYCGADGALVLARTGRLKTEPRRRVFETALLMMELAQPRSLTTGGAGFLMVRRLRLLHAVVRHVVDDRAFDARSSEPVPWPRATHGQPVSQLDLLGTLWCFALTPLDVLDEMGMSVDREARRGWLHLWNVVGEVMGIADPQGVPLLPMEEDEARACFSAIQRRQFRTSPEGIELTAELRQVVKKLLPGRRMDWLVDGSMRCYLGDAHADLLGVPRVDAAPVLGRVRRVLARRWARGAWLQKDSPARHRRMVAGLLEALATWLADEMDGTVPSLRAPEADAMLRDQLESLRREVLGRHRRRSVHRTAGDRED